MGVYKVQQVRVYKVSLFFGFGKWVFIRYIFFISAWSHFFLEKLCICFFAEMRRYLVPLFSKWDLSLKQINPKMAAYKTSLFSKFPSGRLLSLTFSQRRNLKRWVSWSIFDYIVFICKFKAKEHEHKFSLLYELTRKFLAVCYVWRGWTFAEMSFSRFSSL